MCGLRSARGLAILATLFVSAARALPQDARPMTVNFGSVLFWDHPGTDVEGNPEVVVEAEVALSAAADDLSAGAQPVAVRRLPSSGSGRIALGNLFLGRADGPYQLWVRVRDRAGNWSDWSAPLAVEFERGTAPLFRRGDANADGRVDLADAIFTLGFLVLGTEAPKCTDAADSNDSGRVDISDPIYTLLWLFSGGAVPPFPGPRTCGPDLTADSLVDCVQIRC